MKFVTKREFACLQGAGLIYNSADVFRIFKTK